MHNTIEKCRLKIGLCLIPVLITCITFTLLSFSPSIKNEGAGPTKYVYFNAYTGSGLSSKWYYSKIFKVTNYNKDKLAQIKNCLIEKVRFFKSPQGQINIIEHIYDSYSKASEDWQKEPFERLFGDEPCGLSN